MFDPAISKARAEALVEQNNLCVNVSSMKEARNRGRDRSPPSLANLQ